MNHSFSLRLALFLLTFQLCTSQCPTTSLPSGWTAINVSGSSYCYAINNGKTNQAAARGRCWSTFKGFLARFHDVASLRELAKKIKINTNKVWVDLVSKANREWIWSDGTSVNSDILKARTETGSGDGLNCGALTTPKYSKWTSELCTANHEFICQAPKLKTNLGNCANSTFQVNNKCFAVSLEPLTFHSAIAECKEKHNGHLGALENTELAATVANYFTFKKPALKNVRVWTDVVWSQDEEKWKHSDGRKVTFYEENWATPSQKTFINNKSSVVLDQNSVWKWKTRQPKVKAYSVCEVDAADVINGIKMLNNAGKAVAPVVGSTAQKEDPEETTSASSSTVNLILNVRLLAIIVAAVGAVFFILLIIICILCYKKKVCCLKKKKEETSNGGFGTPVSFNFMNPDYGHISEATTAAPQTGAPIEDTPLPHPPLEGDDTYATINDDDPMSPPISTIDLLHAQPTTYCSLVGNSLTRDAGGAPDSPPMTHYSSRISMNQSQESIASRNTLPTPGRGRQMTSFVSPSPHTPNVTSPYYAQMDMKKEKAMPDQTALEYAELAFGGRDEDEQFEVEESSNLQDDRSHGNNRSTTQRRFNERYPEVRMLGVENEHSPLIISPDSPQFPIGDTV